MISGRDTGIRLSFVRQHPSGNIDSGELPNDWRSFAINQLEIILGDGVLLVTNLAPDLPLLHNGIPSDICHVRVGDTLDLGSRLILLCVERPLSLQPFPHFLPGWDAVWGKDIHPFGQPDQVGIVGESEATWILRRRIWEAAFSSNHVLVTGQSRTGKELVAQAIHRLSSRNLNHMEEVDATHIPDSVAELRLVGNVRNFPNPGTPSSVGILGRAPNGVIFIDEFGELPSHVQAKLQRFMDYQTFEPLGGKPTTNLNTRLILATRQPIDRLREDVVSRCPVQIKVTPLNERREDIPLLARHLLSSLMRLLQSQGVHIDAQPSMTRRTVLGLLKHPLTGNMGELLRLCSDCLALSDPPEISSTPELQHILRQEGIEPSSSPSPDIHVLPAGGIFSPEETTLLLLHRQAKFNGRELARSPAYPGEKGMANMRMNLFLIRALAAKKWNIPVALALLQGVADPSALDPSHHAPLIRRSALFLTGSRRRILAHNDEYLTHFWKAYGQGIEWLLMLATAIRQDELVGWEILTSADSPGEVS